MAKKTASNKETTAGAAAGTGTGTKSEGKADAKAKAKVVVEVNPKLLELFKKHDQAAEQAGSFLVEIGEMVTRDNISNPVLIKTIMEARGVELASAKSQASRLRSLMKDKDSFEALKRGEVTVRAAVKGAQARRVATPLSISKAFDAAINKLVIAAKATGQDKRSILATIEAALDKAEIKGGK